MLMRRISIVAGGAAAAMLLSTGSAFAHECYFTNPNPNADAGRAQTSAFMSFHDMIVEFAPFEVCDAGIDVLAEAVGVESSTLVNTKATMAGGTTGNKAIGHIDFGLLETAAGDALDACP